jgi:hypothetical protein
MGQRQTNQFARTLFSARRLNRHRPTVQPSGGACHVAAMPLILKTRLAGANTRPPAMPSWCQRVFADKMVSVLAKGLG